MKKKKTINKNQLPLFTEINFEFGLKKPDKLLQSRRGNKKISTNSSLETLRVALSEGIFASEEEHLDHDRTTATAR